jgi:ribokinase
MKPENTPRVIGLGALNIDRILLAERQLADGETAVRDGGTFPGGSAANTIYGLAKLGIPTGFCGALGDDIQGKLLLRDFRRMGTDATQVSIKPGQASGTVLCISSSQGRALYVLPGANGLIEPGDIEIAYLDQAEYFHVASFVDDAQFVLSRDIVEKLSPRVKLSFSPGALYVSRGMEALKPFFKRSEVLFINREEIETLTADDFRPGAKQCIASGCKVVVVTLGEGFKQGRQNVVAYVRDSASEWYIGAGEPAGLDVADTTGAGDAFATGFLFGMLQAKGLAACGKLGNCAARLSLKCSGARQGLPTRRQLDRLYAKIYPDS